MNDQKQYAVIHADVSARDLDKALNEAADLGYRIVSSVVTEFSAYIVMGLPEQK